MAGRDFAQPYVQRALSEGLGPTAGLRMAREAGLRIANSDWFSTYGQERSNRALQARAVDQPLNRRPTAEDVGRWDTVSRKGFAYRVVHLMEDNETGAQSTIITTVTTDTLISRGRAIQLAMDNISDPEDKYPRSHVGSFMAGVFEMVPLDATDEEL